MYRNDFPLGYWPPGRHPTCQICQKKVFHTWQAGWIYRQPGTVCECEQPRMRIFIKPKLAQGALL